MKTETHHLIFSDDLAENIIRHVPCLNCGAPIGQPCVNSPRDFHVKREDTYRTWIRLYETYYKPTVRAHHGVQL